MNGEGCERGERVPGREHKSSVKNLQVRKEIGSPGAHPLSLQSLRGHVQQVSQVNQQVSSCQDSHSPAFIPDAHRAGEGFFFSPLFYHGSSHHWTTEAAHPTSHERGRVTRDQSAGIEEDGDMVSFYSKG